MSYPLASVRTDLRLRFFITCIFLHIYPELADAGALLKKKATATGESPNPATPALPDPVDADWVEHEPSVNCREFVENWITDHPDRIISRQTGMPGQGLRKPEDLPALDNSSLLFFMHVPRTAGRMLNSCLLRHSTPPSQRCPKSYDGLRLPIVNSASSSPDQPGVAPCSLLSTHDDWSVLARLRSAHGFHNVALATTVRDPSERLLSAYEFVVEVAVRGLQSNGTLESQLRDEGKMVTQYIWPWSVLVPWMRRDMLRRQEARDRLPALGDAYHAPDIVMPLIDFVQHPVVAATLHNGAVLQILGATNNSHDVPAHEAARLAQCAARGGPPAALLAEAAERRMAGFHFVGLFDDLHATARLAAATLGRRMNGTAYKLKTSAQEAAAPYDEGEETADEAEAEPVNPKSVLYSRTESSSNDGLHSQALEPEVSEAVHLKVLESARADVRRAQAAARKASRQQFSSHGHKQAAMASLDAEVVKTKTALSMLEGAAFNRVSEPSELSEPHAGAAEGAEAARTRKAAERAARWAVVDKAAELADDVATTFLKCEHKMKQSGRKRRAKAMGRLRWACGTPLIFSHEARRGLPRQTMAAIRYANSADRLLHAAAQKMHKARVALMAPKMEALPNWTPPPDPLEGPMRPLTPCPNRPRPPIPDPPTAPFPGKPVWPPRRESLNENKTKREQASEKSASPYQDSDGVRKRRPGRKASDTELTEEEEMFMRWADEAKRQQSATKERLDAEAAAHADPVIENPGDLDGLRVSTAPRTARMGPPGTAEPPKRLEAVPKVVATSKPAAVAPKASEGGFKVQKPPAGPKKKQREDEWRDEL